MLPKGVIGQRMRLQPLLQAHSVMIGVRRQAQERGTQMSVGPKGCLFILIAIVVLGVLVGISESGV
ncbi:hypothetical protein [[Kitasatospora] papulosa]|uniref:hypothetical protein n=1 Tax=[Kitasatospora] papulosa TaxID=1464011 RepID=UPI00371E9B1F